MTDLRALLAPIRERLAAATPGPWECDGFAGEGIVDLSIFKDSNQGPTIVEGISRHEDAEFFMNAPTDLARLLAAIEAVERTAANLDRLADGDRHYANLFRQAVAAALGSDTTNQEGTQ